VDTIGDDEEGDFQLKALGGDGLEGLGEAAFEQTAHGFDPLAIIRLEKLESGGQRACRALLAERQQVNLGRLVEKILQGGGM